MSPCSRLKNVMFFFSKCWNLPTSPHCANIQKNKNLTAIKTPDLKNYDKFISYFSGVDFAMSNWTMTMNDKLEEMCKAVV
jgi:hypothetical protein